MSKGKKLNVNNKIRRGIKKENIQWMNEWINKNEEMEGKEWKYLILLILICIIKNGE